METHIDKGEVNAMNAHRRLLALGVVASVLAASTVWSAGASAEPGKVVVSLQQEVEQKDLPAWQRIILKKLDARLSVDFTGESLQTVLDYLRSKAGVNIILNRPLPGVDPNTPLILKLDNVTVRSAVSWSARLAGLDYIVKDEAVFVSTLSDMGAEWREEAENRDQILGRKARGSWIPTMEAKLDELTSFSFENTPLAESLRFLSTLHGINIVLDPRYAGPRHTVTRVVEGMSVKNALTWLLRPHQLTYIFVDEAVFVTTTETARSLRNRLVGGPGDERLHQTISFTIDHATLSDALKGISQTTGVDIRVEGALPDTTISLTRDGIALDKAVQDIVAQSGLSFAFGSDQAGLIVWLQKPTAQPKTSEEEQTEKDE
jgi:hypothetical protein